MRALADGPGEGRSGRLILSLVALGMLTACASIDTRDEASGEIERMNDSEISLDSGGTFVIPPDKQYLVEDLETGQPVTVMYKEENGQKVVQYIFRAM